jgi:hypothetical protein
MRVELPRRPHRPDIVLLMAALIATWFAVKRALAETPAPTAPHTTSLIVFASHRMPEGEWTALFAALRRGATNEAAETPALRGEFEILRGETLPRGLQLDLPIVVFLHGDCTLLPRPLYIQADTLGWVLRSNGRIEPFIHVNCTGLVNMLGPMSQAMSPNRRYMVMAEAMTRVILHEWIHIATQSPSHTKQGVEKRQFGVRDLLADDDVQRYRAARERRKKTSQSAPRSSPVGNGFE